jgi:uncharacterized protein
MWKLFLFLIAVWLVVTLLKRQKSKAANTTPQEDHAKSDDMVACAVCGVHTPKSEAIASQNLYYCSEAHFLERK